MYLIKNIRLYTGEASYEHGAVLTDGDRIVFAGSEEDLPETSTGDVTEIDGHGGICMPGLCNAHTHAPMVLLRGEGADLPLAEWLSCVMKLEDNFTPETIYTGTMLAIMEMLRGGVTSFADMYFMCGDMIRAVLQSGIRANITRGSTSFEGVLSHKAWHDEYDGADGRLRVYTGLHAEYTSDESIARAAIECAKELGVGIHVHLSESAPEVAGCIERHGVTPPEYFARLGLFDLPVIAAHCVHLTDSDIDILSEHSVTAAHCPASNMYLASGISPTAKLSRRGVPVAIGTDGAASNNTLDMFREMRLAALLAKVSTCAADAIPARDIITMATVNRARAMGFSDVGVLAAGKAADLVILDGEALHLNADDIATAVVYSAVGADVKLTMVGGRVLFRDGEFMTIDAERMIAEGKAAASFLRGK